MSVRIAARNFGPIERGSVTLGPLTIFIGPNNAGKSAFAMLTYAVMNHVPVSAQRPPRIPPIARQRSVSPSYLYWARLQQQENFDSLRDDIKGFLEQTSTSKQITSRSVSPELRQHLSDMLRFTLERYGQEVCGELERCFGAKLIDLVRINSESSPEGSITISHDNPRWELGITLRKTRPSIEISRFPN